MKTIPFAVLVPLVLMLSGCATTSRVQEMINQARQEDLARQEEQNATIELSKKSAITALEKAKESAEAMAAMEARVAEMQRQLAQIREHADTARIMSAANLVKLADLDEALAAFKVSFNKGVSQLGEIDKLHQQVMMTHYQTMIDSAAAALQALKMDGVSPSNAVPVRLSAPIEIVAPDTSAPSNSTSISTNMIPAQ